MNTEKQRKYRARNPGKAAAYQRAYCQRYPQRAKQSATTAYLKARALLDKLKSVPCADCGQCYPSCVMDFDHRDPTAKRFNVSEAVRARAVLEEAAKCDVVCANCHRLRTHTKEMDFKINRGRIFTEDVKVGGSDPDEVPF